MLPVGDLYVTGRSLHADSLLLFAALAELIETGLQVRSLLSLTLQLLFKLVDHRMGVTRLRSFLSAGVSLAGRGTVGASSGGSGLLLRSRLLGESGHALGLVASARRNGLGDLFGS
jgi:hypothetical protein